MVIYVMSFGDSKRFTAIYKQEVNTLFRFCLLRVTDREKAMDLTQETFTRLWNTMLSGKDIENPRALLYVVMRNLIIDWYRRVKAVSLEGLSSDDEREFDPEDTRAASEIEISSDARRALEMLNHLEPQYREVIYFRYVEGLSPKDIALIMNSNPNTISVRLTRGMEALKKLMGIPKKSHE
jgi:RNA polymerase sigma factor (sigma-70 family)